VFPRRLEALLEKLLEKLEPRTRYSSHDVDVLLQVQRRRGSKDARTKGRSRGRETNHRELERGSLEAHVSWTVGEHETEVDMDAVSFAIDENVSVVTILDLEEVGRHRVAWKSEERKEMRRSV